MTFQGRPGGFCPVRWEVTAQTSILSHLKKQARGQVSSEPRSKEPGLFTGNLRAEGPAVLAALSCVALWVSQWQSLGRRVLCVCKHTHSHSRKCAHVHLFPDRSVCGTAPVHASCSKLTPQHQYQAALFPHVCDPLPWTGLALVFLGLSADPLGPPCPRSPSPVRGLPSPVPAAPHKMPRGHTGAAEELVLKGADK